MWGKLGYDVDASIDARGTLEKGAEFVVELRVRRLHQDQHLVEFQVIVYEIVWGRRGSRGGVSVADLDQAAFH